MTFYLTKLREFLEYYLSKYRSEIESFDWFSRPFCFGHF